MSPHHIQVDLTSFMKVTTLTLSKTETRRFVTPAARFEAQFTPDGPPLPHPPYLIYRVTILTLTQLQHGLFGRRPLHCDQRVPGCLYVYLATVPSGFQYICTPRSLHGYCG